MRDVELRHTLSDFGRTHQFEFWISERDVLMGQIETVIDRAVDKAADILAQRLVIEAENRRTEMKIEVYKDASRDGYRWRAIDTNGRIIADGSESYATEQNAVRGLKNVIGEFRTLTGYFAPDGTHVFLDPTREEK